jgi:hypothetical protein
MEFKKRISTFFLAFLLIGYFVLESIRDDSGNGFLRKLLESQEHKNLFPLDSYDLIGTILVTLGLLIAASGGIGGEFSSAHFYFRRPKYVSPLRQVVVF